MDKQLVDGQVRHGGTSTFAADPFANDFGNLLSFLIVERKTICRCNIVPS